MEENIISIKKAKIVDEQFLDVEFTERLPNHADKKVKLSCTVPVHDDLKLAFATLHKHLAILCDEVEVGKKEKFANLDFPSFGARSFSIGGNDDSEGVTISGYKVGKYGMVNLNTPFVKYGNDEYPFTSELGENIQACLYEVSEYLFNGKKAPDLQIEIAFPEEENK
jgi:hypothetical protein